MSKKSKKPDIVRSPCPKCGKMISKRGMNGHNLICKGPAQGAGSGDKPVGHSSTVPNPAPNNATVSLDSMLLKEAGVEKVQAPDGTSTLQPVEPPQASPYTVSARTWGHILMMLGQGLDGVVDEVKKKKPNAVIVKVNLTETRANHVGELMASQIGPIDPKTALLLEIAGIFLPTAFGLIAAIMPPAWLNKITENFNKMLKKVELPGAVKDGQANPPS